MDSEQISRHEKIFDLFSRSKSKTVEISDLKKLLLLAGHTVTTSEVNELITSINKEEITLDDFLKICYKLNRENVTKEELKQAFESLDSDNTRHVPLKKLIEVLNEGDNKLSDMEINELTDILDPDANGLINYDILIQDLYSNNQVDE